MKKPFRKPPELLELGANLEEARLRRGLTQARSARAAGISRRHLSESLQGHNFSVVVLRKIMRAFDLTVVDLGEGLTATSSMSGIQPAEVLTLLDAFGDGLMEIERSMAKMREAIGATRAHVQRQLAAPRVADARELVQKVRSAHPSAGEEQPPDNGGKKQAPVSARKRRRGGS